MTQINVPRRIGSSRVLFFAKADGRCRWTGKCRHFKSGELIEPAPYLAICECGNMFYLFGCDVDWKPNWETSHRTLREAMNQAQYEYKGVQECWEGVPEGDIVAVDRTCAEETPRVFSNTDLIWSGPLFDWSGYARMNRELVLRLHPFRRVRLETDGVMPGRIAEDSIRGRLLVLREGKVSPDATWVNGYTPTPVFAQGRRVCFTMTETQSVHSDFLRRLNDYYDECWTPTSWNRDTFLDSGVRIPVHVIPLGIDPEIYFPTGPSQMPRAELLSTPRAGSIEVPKGMVFITLYQPGFRKGIDYLIDSFERAFGNDSDVALVLATTVYSSSQVSQAIAAKGLKARVYGLRGAFWDRELAAIFRSSHAYVSTSVGEGWNLPLIEAAACGLPVIAGSHTAHSELLRDDTAFLFHPEGFAPIPGSAFQCPWYGEQSFAHFGSRSTEELVSLFHEVKDDYSSAMAKGMRFAQEIRARFTWDRACEQIMSRLNS